MKIRHTTYLVVGLCGLLALAESCRQRDVATTAQQPAALAATHTYSEKGSVREMAIMPQELSFPEGEGKTEFTSYCGICHSLTYITSQPPLSRDAWAAEVHKMVERYGAPIDTANARKITDYLVRINGL